MTLDSFITRLIFCLIAGLLFIAAFKRLAIANPIEADQKPNKELRWLGWTFTVFAILQFVAFVIWGTNLNFSIEVVEPLIPLDGIVRSSSNHILWGYANQVQRFCFTFFIGTFACIGFAQYFFKFLSSPSKWWSKMLKVFWYVIIWVLYVNCVDFHYFDIPEFIKTILFAVALIICFNRSISPKERNSKKAETPSPPVYKAEADIVEVSYKSISRETISEVAQETISTEHVVEETSIVIKPSDKTTMQYCRFCGNKIEADAKFCKYCGKQTNISSPFVKTASNLIMNAIGFCKGITSKIVIPISKIKFTKSEPKDFKTLKWLKIIVPVCLIIGIIGVILCVCYFNHPWNYSGFNCHGVQDKFNLFKGFSIAIVIFGFLTWLFQRWHKISELHFVKFATFIFAYFTYASCLGIVVSTIISACKFDKYYHSIELDYAITNYKSSLHKESVNQFLERLNGTILDKYGYPSEVVNILTLESKHNNAIAQNELGRHYFSYHEWGKEEPDYRRSIFWFKKAYENGNPAGAYNVGLCYDYGKGVSENIEQAVEWTRKAADEEYARAELKMGDFYKEGVYSWHGIWSQREMMSSENRIYEFAVSNGETQFTSLVLEKNLNEAKKWWQKSYKHGNEDALQRLESFYE